MKALVELRPEEGLWLTDSPGARAGRDDVLVKVLSHRHLACMGHDTC